MIKVVLPFIMCLILLVGCTTPAVVQPTPEPEVVLPIEEPTEPIVLPPVEEPIVEELIVEEPVVEEPAVEDPAIEEVNTSSNGEVEELRAELEDVCTELTRVKAERDDLIQRLSTARQQVEESRFEYGTLWEQYQTLGLKKTNQYEKLLRLQESQFVSLRELQSDHDTLQSSYSALQVNYNRLYTDYTYLQTHPPIQPRSFEITEPSVPVTVYEALKAERDVLQSSYTNLSSNYASLESKYNYSQSTYSALKVKYSKLGSAIVGIKYQLQSLMNNSFSICKAEAYRKVLNMLQMLPRYK